MHSDKFKSPPRKEQRKYKRLHLLVDIDLCACCGGHQLKCSGICRESHTDPKTKLVECGEMYRIDLRSQSNRKSNRKRDNDIDENRHAKIKRSIKFVKRESDEGV